MMLAAIKGTHDFFPPVFRPRVIPRHKTMKGNYILLRQGPAMPTYIFIVAALPSLLNGTYGIYQSNYAPGEG